ncbi:cyclic pyranopterin monophosphate synthase MoaC [Candidatus Latescibacterota bacterium]
MKDKLAFSHLSKSGSAKMVNISEKNSTLRMARAEAWVHVGPEIIKQLKKEGGFSKGNVIETAKLAGIMAAKRTSELIPMCHQIPLDVIEIITEFIDDSVRIESRVECVWKTGVEMEAMTSASVAALTIYDMVKSAGKGIQIGPLRLLEKTGGKSGRWESTEVLDGNN